MASPGVTDLRYDGMMSGRCNHTNDVRLLILQPDRSRDLHGMMRRDKGGASQTRGENMMVQITQGAQAGEFGKVVGTEGCEGNIIIVVMSAWCFSILQKGAHTTHRTTESFRCLFGKVTPWRRCRPSPSGPAGKHQSLVSGLSRL